jgi:hypothetical protein
MGTKCRTCVRLLAGPVRQRPAPRRWRNGEKFRMDSTSFKRAAPGFSAPRSPAVGPGLVGAFHPGPCAPSPQPCGRTSRTMLRFSRPKWRFPGGGPACAGPMNRGLESQKTFPNLSAAGRPIGPGAGVAGCPAHCPYPCCSTDVAMRTCDFPPAMVAALDRPHKQHPVGCVPPATTSGRPLAMNQPNRSLRQGGCHARENGDPGHPDRP